MLAEGVIAYVTMLDGNKYNHHVIVIMTVRNWTCDCGNTRGKHIKCTPHYQF